MNEIALLWHQDFVTGKELMKNDSRETWERAYELFTRSARSFPDSYVAAECHKYRSDLLRELGRPEEAEQEKKGLRSSMFHWNKFI